MGLLVHAQTLIGLGVCLVAGTASGAVLPPQREPPKCGYESCPRSDPKRLNIHLVSHTHDDVGWLKTVDQYYYGAHMEIQRACVECIIDSVVNALIQDPNRRFIYVETAFLWKWVKHAPLNRLEIMKELINQGRLEIIGGAWSMNDEACTYYHSIIDQFTWGFRRLDDTFGECARPKIGWQIDPFGHSREQASIFTQLGFDGLLFARLDYMDKSKRLADKTAEFIWQGSSSLGDSSNLFTSVLYHHYDAPDGFCFDTLCPSTVPIIDDPDSPDYNVDSRVNDFLLAVEDQALHYRTNNIILTMGSDFNYQIAESYFKNTDKLIKYINKYNRSRFKAFYSTPSCYLKAVNDKNLTWTTKFDDFMPYSNDPHAFWTGYFTSRPTIKFFERMGNNFLQVVKQLSVLSNMPDSEELQRFRQAMGVMQHHDAVTGTEKQHVADDYARLLDRSMQRGAQLASRALNKLTTKKHLRITPQFYSCQLLNISTCSHSSDNDKFVVTVYNPTGLPLTTYIRLPVQGFSYGVQDFSGKEVVTQIVPIPEEVRSIPGRSSNATNELIFPAININPLGYQSFYIIRKTDEMNIFQEDQPSDNSEKVIGGQSYKISIRPDGKVQVDSLKGEKTINLVQSFHYYEAAAGNNSGFENRASGAYILRPKTNRAISFPKPTNVKTFKGPLVEEMHLTYNEWVSQVIRINNDTDYVEFNWLVGPIPVLDEIGKEVITTYTANVINKGVFYTDSNGREMMKRKLNYRPTWDMIPEEPVAGNYYPVTTKISIQDDTAKLRVSALTDRAHGGSSLKTGDIELMVHRRLLHDDAFGVEEALNETAFGKGLVVRGQHYLISGSLEDQDELILKEKLLATRLALRPWIFLTPVEQSFEEWSTHFKMRDDRLIKKLPVNIRLLTLEPWKEGEILLRLEHIFEKSETVKYSKNVEIDILELLPGFKVQGIQETTLGANMRIDEVQRLKWYPETNKIPTKENEKQESVNISEDSAVVELKPMEIRTFIISIGS